MTDATKRARASALGPNAGPAMIYIKAFRILERYAVPKSPQATHKDRSGPRRLRFETIAPEVEITPLVIFRLASGHSRVFREIADREPSATSVFFGTSIWLGLAPPVFAYFGAAHFGWITGAPEPLFLSPRQLLSVSIAYFCVLLAGFLLTAAVSQWMASSYGARRSLGVHLALITTIGAPLALGSVAHLYPHMVLNFLVLVPMLIWSLYLLYSGLPIALETDRERGMLMASSLVAFLLVAAVSLLGLTVALWTQGIGPSIWI